MLESYLVPLLVKLGVVASIASILARSSSFKCHADAGEPHPESAACAALWSVRRLWRQRGTRVVSQHYQAADLGLEGSLLAGILGGYVTGCCRAS